MKDFDKDMQEFFRNNHLEDAFPADEDNWKVLAAEIEARKKKRRRFFFFLNTLLLLGVGVVVYLINFTTPPALTASTSSPVKSALDTTNNTPSSQLLTSNTHPRISSASRALKPEQINDAPVVKKHGMKTGPSVSSPPPTMEAGIKNARAAITTSTSKDVTSFEVPANREQPTTAIKKENQPSLNAVATSSVEQIVTTEKRKEVREEFVTDSKSANNTANVTKVDTTTPTSAFVPTNKVPLATTPTIGSTTLTGSNTTLMDTTTTKTEQVVDTSTPNLIKADTIKKDSVYVSQADSSSQQKRMDSTSLKNMALKGLYVEASGMYLRSWYSNDTKEPKGIQPLLGLQHYYPLNNRLSVSGGVHYSYVQLTGATSHTSSATRIRFGEETQMTVIKAMNLHYLMLPLRFNYSLSQKDVLGIGYTASYLLNVGSRVETYLTEMGGTRLTESHFENGYSKGFNTWDNQVSVFYRRRIIKHWFVGAEFFYGFMDIKNNAIYLYDSVERLMGLRITVSMGLYKN